MEEQKPLEILVIDDEEAVKEVLVRLISAVGGTAYAATNGQEGIDMFIARHGEGRPYNAVFTDLSMAEKTGVDVCREVKSKSPETPVYVITAYEPNQEYKKLKDQLGELKPDGVLQKPIQLQTIIDLVGKIRLQIYHVVGSPDYKPLTQS